MLLEKGAEIDVVGYDRMHATTPLLAALTGNVMGNWTDGNTDGDCQHPRTEGKVQLPI